MLEFSSRSKHFSQRPVISTYLTKHPGRVITSDVIASLIGEVWPQSLTPLNIMGGFKKCGIYPLNLGAVTDRQVVPIPRSRSDCSLATKQFSQEQEILFKKRFEEGYNVYEPDYVMWLKHNHPVAATHARTVATIKSEFHWPFR